MGIKKDGGGEKYSFSTFEGGAVTLRAIHVLPERAYFLEEEGGDGKF